MSCSRFFFVLVVDIIQTKQESCIIIASLFSDIIVRTQRLVFLFYFIEIVFFFPLSGRESESQFDTVAVARREGVR